MRLFFPKEVEDMEDKLRPYIILDGINFSLRKEAPKEIVSLWKKYRDTLDEIFQKAEALNAV